MTRRKDEDRSDRENEAAGTGEELMTLDEIMARFSAESLEIDGDTAAKILSEAGIARIRALGSGFEGHYLPSATARRNKIPPEAVEDAILPEWLQSEIAERDSRLSALATQVGILMGRRAGMEREPDERVAGLALGAIQPGRTAPQNLKEVLLDEGSGTSKRIPICWRGRLVGHLEDVQFETLVAGGYSCLRREGRWIPLDTPEAEEFLKEVAEAERRVGSDQRVEVDPLPAPESQRLDRKAFFWLDGEYGSLLSEWRRR